MTTRSKLAWIISRVLINIGLLVGASFGVQSIIPPTTIQQLQTTSPTASPTTSPIQFDTFEGKLVSHALPSQVELVDIYDIYVDTSPEPEDVTYTDYGENEPATDDATT